MHRDAVRPTGGEKVTERGLIITIDGPAASGKSSVSRLVADSLGMPYVSSGLFYRAATYLALKEKLPQEESLILDCLRRCRVTLEPVPGGHNRVQIDGQDVTEALHTDDVDANVSAVSRHAGVRAWVNSRLREIPGSFVIEGRDMGTVVFPGAKHKFYLTAPAEVRAMRRVGERSASLPEVTEALKTRDARDAAQLQPAVDALHLDTQNLTLLEVVARILQGVQS